MEKQLNFSKFLFFAIWTYTTTGKIDQNKLTVGANTYTFDKIGFKPLFLLKKYLIVFAVMFYMITKYEINYHYIDILLGSIVGSIYYLVNLRYNTNTTMLVVSVWYLFFTFIMGIDHAGLIFKYAVFSYVIYSFVLDLKRQYYAVYQDQHVVSYMFIKSDKI